MLVELRLIDTETQLASWIEKNFSEPDAVREVASNINFFGSETADILDFRLNRAKGILLLLVTCWRLIIRHMRSAKRGALREEWFEILPRLKRGEQSAELLERIANVLRPRLRVGKHLSWTDKEDACDPQRPADLMSIDYEVEDGLTDESVLSAWPDDASADTDDKLLRLLTHALTAALEDASEARVEGDVGYSLSDTDVASVAGHQQNAYRSGFLPIVRVTADLWSRLARKDVRRALVLVEIWRASPFRLIRRLAIFAAADPAVPADVAANILMTLPPAELFFANSSVETYRLIDARWASFAANDQQAIERVIAKGPPAERFREDQERMVDRCRFDLLGHLERSGVQLGTDAQSVLTEIRRRWPDWQLRPQAQAGFQIWHEGSSLIVGDPAKLSGVPDSQLIAASKKAADEADFLEGDAWQALCATDTPRALRGLEAQATIGDWPAWAWRTFLWAAGAQKDLSHVTRTAQLLLEWPKEGFGEIAREAAWWLNEMAKTLNEELLWRLWDRLVEVFLLEEEKA